MVFPKQFLRSSSDAHCACSLDALDPNAYNAYKSVHDLDAVVDRVLAHRGGGGGSAGGAAARGSSDEEGEDAPSSKLGGRSLSTGIRLMAPVQPMLVRVDTSTK